MAKRNETPNLRPTTFRLDAETDNLLDSLAERYGLKRVQVIKVALRFYAAHGAPRAAR